MIYKLPSIETVDVTGKIVAVRSNLNTFINGESPEHNQTIKSTIATLNYLASKNAKVIVLGTLGKPMGSIEDNLSLMDVRFAIGHLLNKPTKFVNIKNSLNSIKFMNFGEVLILENLGFQPEEISEKSEDWKILTEHLSNLVDYFVIDTVDIDYSSGSLKYLTKKKPAFMGLGLQKEISTLKGFVNDKSNNSKILILGKESNLDLESDLIKDFINKFEYIYTSEKLPNGLKPKYINTLEDLKVQIESVESVVWIGKLEMYGQDVLEYLSLSVGKEVKKIIGGSDLVELLNHSKYKEKGITFISTSGKNLINILLGKEIKLN